MNPLPLSFYQREDVVAIAQELLGKALYTQTSDSITGGIIIETESYKGPEDKASHAYNNRRTARTEVMFSSGGIAYVYLCYGMHNLLNVVTNTQDIPHAVLIRALFPTHGIETMKKRRATSPSDLRLTSGPGALCQALGITRAHNALPFDQHPLWIEDTSISFSKDKIIASPRIGVDYAGEDALLPWRFRIPIHAITSGVEKPLIL